MLLFSIYRFLMFYSGEPTGFQPTVVGCVFRQNIREFFGRQILKIIRMEAGPDGLGV